MIPTHARQAEVASLPVLLGCALRALVRCRQSLEVLPPVVDVATVCSGIEITAGSKACTPALPPQASSITSSEQAYQHRCSWPGLQMLRACCHRTGPWPPPGCATSQPEPPWAAGEAGSDPSVSRDEALEKPTRTKDKGCGTLKAAVRDRKEVCIAIVCLWGGGGQEQGEEGAVRMMRC